MPNKIYIHRKEKPLEITWSEVEEKNATNIEYIRKKFILGFLGKVSIEVNSFTHSSANDFRAEGANKVISLIKDCIESL